MKEDLKKVYLKQMLLPKEELALQTMELMADKMILEENWNKLKEWLEEVIDYEEYDKVERDTFKKTLEKMQEIEGGMNE